jgi:hypothetical protein
MVGGPPTKTGAPAGTGMTVLVGNTMPLGVDFLDFGRGGGGIPTP